MKVEEKQKVDKTKSTHAHACTLFPDGPTLTACHSSGNFRQGSLHLTRLYEIDVNSTCKKLYNTINKGYNVFLTIHLECKPDYDLRTRAVSPVYYLRSRRSGTGANTEDYNGPQQRKKETKKAVKICQKRHHHGNEQQPLNDRSYVGEARVSHLISIPYHRDKKAYKN